MSDKDMERLYELLETVEDADMEATLRKAIFELERM